MSKGDKEYKIMKDACKEAGCYIPEDFTFHGAVANTPMFLREYFRAKGEKECDKKWEESIEIMNNPEIMEGLKNAMEDFKAGRFTVLKSDTESVQEASL